MLRSPPATEEESASARPGKYKARPQKFANAAGARVRSLPAGAWAVAARPAASRNNFAKAFTLEAQGQRITPNGLHTPKKGEWPGVKLRTEG